MSRWIDSSETILTALGIPYRLDRFECSTAQLPDTYITYFLIDDPAKTWGDNKETAHNPRFQISLFYRDIALIKTLPLQIEEAFIADNFLRISAGRIPYSQDTGHYGWRVDFRDFERRN